MTKDEIIHICKLLDEKALADEREEYEEGRRYEMNDRELLELAAKAAGITLTPVEIKNVTKQGDDRFIGYQTDPDQWPRGWFDPRHDNNDAFRLAARLKIQVAFGTFKDNVASAYKFGAPAVEVENTDIEAAAREAIFLMAAEIGKGME